MPFPLSLSCVFNREEMKTDEINKKPFSFCKCQHILKNVKCIKISVRGRKVIKVVLLVQQLCSHQACGRARCSVCALIFVSMETNITLYLRQNVADDVINCSVAQSSIFWSIIGSSSTPLTTPTVRIRQSRTGINEPATMMLLSQ